MRMRAIHSSKPGFIDIKISEHKCACFIRPYILRAWGGITAFAIFKSRAEKADGFIGFTGHRLGEQQRRNDHGPFLARRVSEDELPGYAVFIGYPAITFTKRIAIQRHQYFSVLNQLAPNLVDVLGGIRVARGVEVDHKGNRWIDPKLVPGADTQERLTGNGKFDYFAFAAGHWKMIHIIDSRARH